jgi:hypothetical protein
MCGKGKRGKYLLITPSFPHSQQTSPQEFSTGSGSCGKDVWININPGRFWQSLATFWRSVVFTMTNSLCKNSDLTDLASEGRRIGNRVGSVEPFPDWDWKVNRETRNV